VNRKRKTPYKRTASKKRPSGQKGNHSLLKTVLVVVAAFFLGLLVERYDLPFDGLEARWDQIVHSIRQWSNTVDFDPSEEEYVVDIRVFDVGQGSSMLLKGYDGTTILIDTGRFDDSEKRIIHYLNDEIGVGGKIDLLIFTHNDADHIGNGELVLEYFQVGEVWMNGMDHTSQTYTRVLDALLASNVTYVEAKRGETYTKGAFTIDVLHPQQDATESNQNDESIATRLSIGDTQFIQTGDIDASIEAEIAHERPYAVSADIMMIGHHGSRYSAGMEWIEAVDPAVAFYQAGQDNSYGHPHQEVLDRLEALDIPVYGTDTFGTLSLTILSDGEWDLTTEEE